MIFTHWEKKFEMKLTSAVSGCDPAHDLLHVKRVVRLAKQLCAKEGGQLEIVLPAAWFHDLVVVPKNSSQRTQASRLSAERALEYLGSAGYPTEYFEGIAHAIEGHSFSANLEVKTIEAKIVQDADRLDALGAIGIARCFATAGLLQRSFYNLGDPFCEVRAPEDAKFTVDHFYSKLFEIAKTLKTQSGLEEGQRRFSTMRSYLAALRGEIEPEL